MAFPELLSETLARIAWGEIRLHYVVLSTPKGPHQFVVAVGRLSFAEQPDEVSAQDREAGAVVMDLVMTGPESESVWTLFQEEDGEGRGAEEHRWRQG